MKILVVEDEPGIASFLKQGLEEESYQVDVCLDGNRGLQMALNGRYDLLLLDWMLPGMTGIELCAEYRKSNHETPIIFLTAKDTPQEAITGLRTGANDYIRKPFHFNELLERIHVQLRSAEAADPILNWGNISLDTSAHKVMQGSNEIQLTQKEFDLLHYLLKHKGEVCTRKDIIRDVWDIHFEYNTAVIDVYINALRKKLDLNDHQHILTVRGIGYIAQEE
ncbi:MAG: response regulator transcription factor [Flavobacteriales bacterium]|nr:response regulator transcription factor [Flavobacteriales bacterium]